MTEISLLCRLHCKHADSLRAGRMTEIPLLCRLHFKHADSLRAGQNKSCSSAMLQPAATVPQLLRLLMQLRQSLSP